MPTIRRPCSRCGVLIQSPATYCSRCEAARYACRGTTTSGGLGWSYAKKRLRILERDEGAIVPGAIGARPLVVCGRPLGDWLDLGDVARLLHLWHESPRA